MVLLVILSFKVFGRVKVSKEPLMCGDVFL